MIVKPTPRVRSVAVRLRVSNLPFAMTAAQLQELFSEAGPVVSVEVIYHAETGYPRGFAFVLMETGSASSDAIVRFNGFVHHGRMLQVTSERATILSRSTRELDHA